MGRFLQVALVATLTLLAACGESRPPSSPPASGNGQTITGRERFGWTQTTNNPGDLSLYRYALYVDGTRRVVEGDTCGATGSETTFDCSAPLPAMAPGQHTLELAVFVTSGDTVVESARSAPLQVAIAGLTAPADGIAAHGGTLVSSDGLRLRVDILARDLTDPVDLAAAADGRVFVAERRGTVRLIDPATSPESAARAENVLRQTARDSESALMSIALSPDFAQTGIVHIVYVTSPGERATAILQIARLRESGGILAQAAVIASHVVSADAAALARFGPDGTMYVGVGTGADSDGAQRLASASGKILRLRRDGTTPDDNPWSSPVFSAGHRDPRGLAWHPATGALFEVETHEAGDELNAIRAGANYGWPVASGADRRPGVTPAALLLPPGTEPSGIAAVAVPTSPLFGDLIVSALGGEDLLRVHVGDPGQPKIAGRLLQRRFGRIARVIAAADGALYAITANAQTWGAGTDLLIRVAPLDR